MDIENLNEANSGSTYDIIKSGAARGILKTPEMNTGAVSFISGNLERFRNRLEDILIPNLSAKELIYLMVKSALETEFGRSFTINKGFDTMVKKVSDSIMTTPDLRRQALSIVSTILEKKLDPGKLN